MYRSHSEPFFLRATFCLQNKKKKNRKTEIAFCGIRFYCWPRTALLYRYITSGSISTSTSHNGNLCFLKLFAVTEIAGWGFIKSSHVLQGAFFLFCSFAIKPSQQDISEIIAYCMNTISSGGNIIICNVPCATKEVKSLLSISPTPTHKPFVTLKAYTSCLLSNYLVLIFSSRRFMFTL
jgi:hypothetical protein